MSLNLDEAQKTSPPPHCSSWELAVYVALGGFLPQGEAVEMTGVCSCSYGDCHRKQTVDQVLEVWYK